MNIPIHWNSEPLVDIIKDPAVKIINLHCKTVIKIMLPISTLQKLL